MVALTAPDKGKEEVSDSDSELGAESGDESSVMLEADTDDDTDVIFLEESECSDYLISPLPRTPQSGQVKVMDTNKIVEKALREMAVVSSTLAVSNGLAMSVLMAHGWNNERALQAWFDDPDGCRASVGGSSAGEIPATSVLGAGSPQLCGVCFMEAEDELIGLECGHGFCVHCWRGFVECEIQNGNACVMARCMADKCKMVVPRSFVASLVDASALDRYDTFLAGSYVAAKAGVKWCPNPRGGCDRAASYLGFDTATVECDCGFAWCFFCSEELHLPASCEVVENWIKKNSDSAESTEWILANTKPCPKCNVHIQKNQGCMHMTCRAPGCNFEWCWLCRGPWKDHGTSTGGFYKCNRYESSKAAKEDAKASKVKESHDRYVHYFERYHNHDVSRGFARKISAAATAAADEYAEATGWNGRFLVEAAELVIQARQVLKWSYAHAYYMPEDSQLRTMFEDQQESLETKTEHLSELIEQPIEEMNVTHLKNYRKVLATYLGNLARAWQEYQ